MGAIPADIMRYYFVSGLLTLVLNVAQAQDSIRLRASLSIETRGQHNLATLVDDFDCLHCLNERVADNPFFHLAVYTGIDHELTLNERYKLQTGLYLEERSYSAGNNTLANLVVFPRIRLTVDDTLHLWRKAIPVHLDGGDYWDEDLSDFLRIYNIDYQAFRTAFRIDRFTFSFLTIGDLSSNVGLDLHQLYKFSLAYTRKQFRTAGAISINELFIPPRGAHPATTDINISEYFEWQLAEQLALQAQMEFRVNPELPLGAALGVKADYCTDKLQLSSVLRYYDADFNAGYAGRGPNYLGPGGRYVGRQLYPLKNFYRPFSQWALYTHLPAGNLLAWSLVATRRQEVYKKLALFGDLDFHYIHNLSVGEGHFFPIYNAGVQLDFLKVFNARISLTNKHMDLQRFYQTAAISRQPFLALGFSMRLSELPLGTTYLPEP